MHKLKLRLESLRVETFETTRVQTERGTVFGEQCSCHTVCTCPGCATCDASRNGTCNASNACYMGTNGTICGTCNGGECTPYATIIEY